MNVATITTPGGCTSTCVAKHDLGDHDCAFPPVGVPLLQPVPGHDTHLLIGAFGTGDDAWVELDVDGIAARIRLDHLEAAVHTVRGLTR